MDDGSRLPWIMAIILVILAAVFAMIETALASASKVKIKVACEHGVKGAERALLCMEHFDDAISTLLICTNIVHISAASLVTLAVTRIWGLSAVSVSTVITTIVVFFVGEMLPKSIAKNYSEPILLSMAGFLSFLMKICSPLAKLLAAIGRVALKVGKNDGENEVSVTEDELYDIIEDMAEEGSIDEEQEELISSALQFGDVTVDSILTPRVDMSALNVNMEPEEVLNYVIKQNHSRIPVYEESKDNIIGVLQIRKFLKQYLKTKKIPRVRPMIDPVYFTSQSTRVDELLPILSENKMNMAVITDSYGGTLGIVTIEDILEELVGEIWDEDDIVKEPIVTLGNGMLLVSGDETVGDVFDEIDFEDPEDDERFTNLLVADWVCEHFSELPKVGDHFEYHGVKLHVSLMNHNRILRVRVTAPAKEEKEGGEEA